MINIRRESADPGSLPSVRIRLMGASAEPAGMPQLCRQIEPYADPRLGAVPTGRRHDVHQQSKAVTQPPVIGHIHEEIAACGANS